MRGATRSRPRQTGTRSCRGSRRTSKRLHANGGPQRVVAQLSSYVAAIAMSSGEPGLASRWWRRARSAAVAAGDSHLIAYVTGRQALQGLYGAYSPQHVVVLADVALGATTRPARVALPRSEPRRRHLPCSAVREPRATRWRSLSGRSRSCPATSRAKSCRRSAGPKKRCTTRAATAACSSAVARLPAMRRYGCTSDADWRGPAQIRLHRAASEADAQEALATLTGTQRDPARGQVRPDDRHASTRLVRVAQGCRDCRASRSPARLIHD